MKKKNIKVKKGNGDISITIENNLNANNKQINHQPIKRKRRKKKVENNEEINKETLQQSQPELPSYIKPGPVGAFKIWQNTMDSYNTTVPMNQAQQLGVVPPQLPAPPAQLALPAPPTPLALPAPATPLALPAPATPLALPAPEQQQGISFDNFAKFFAMMSNNQRNIRAPREWGSNLIDDDDNDDANTRYNIRTVPSTPVPSTPLRTPAQTYEEIEFDKGVENLIKQEIEKKGDITGEEMLSIRKDARDKQIRKTAKRMGTIHGQAKIPPNGQYMDLKEYQESYKFALEHAQLLPQPIGRTRAQTKKGLFTKEELAQINEETKQVDDQIASLNLDKWNKEEELAKAGLKTTVMTRAQIRKGLSDLNTIVMTNEDAEDAEKETNRLLFGN